MLSKKNIYTLFFICVTHLGCMSPYRNQMEKKEGKGDELGFQSTSKIEGIYTSSCEGSDVQYTIEYEELSKDDLSYKINNFLENNELELSFAITDDILDSVFTKLSMNKDSFNSYKLKEYKEFLNKYGSIRNTKFDIYKCKLDENEEFYDNIKEDNKNTKIEKIRSIQDDFHNYFVSKPRLHKKYSWLIAKDKACQYYINLEKNSNLGHIYCIDSAGKLIHFAKNFSEFLDKFFEGYEKSIQ